MGPSAVRGRLAPRRHAQRWRSTGTALPLSCSECLQFSCGTQLRLCGCSLVQPLGAALASSLPAGPSSEQEGQLALNSVQLSPSRPWPAGCGMTCFAASWRGTTFKGPSAHEVGAGGAAVRHRYSPSPLHALPTCLGRPQGRGCSTSPRLPCNMQRRWHKAPARPTQAPQ